MQFEVDRDPRYNYTKECDGPTAAERRTCFSDVCRCFHDHLDYGTLSITYGSLWRNDTSENVYAHMTPTTAVEIGEGFVIGLERSELQHKCELFFEFLLKMKEIMRNFPFKSVIVY